MSKEERRLKIALAGNPNSGKTTIFNNITGARQHVGNYPGVTVERKEGECKYEGQHLLFVDLPGTYSLTARSLDELVARNAIINDDPDVLVNVVDASNLERNLYLTAQLIELEIPMVVALNMVDVAEDMGIHLDVDKLASLTGCIVTPTIGRNNKGTKEVLDGVLKQGEEKKKPGVRIDYGNVLEPVIEEVTSYAEKVKGLPFPARYVALKLLEHDGDVVEKVQSLEGSDELLNFVEKSREELKDKVDLEIIFQEYRHRFAVSVYNDCLKDRPKDIISRSDKLDKILTHRIWGLPIFALVMFILFNLVFTLGAYPQDAITDGFTALGNWTTTVIPDGQLQSLVNDGIIAGVGTVLSFLPLILILFLGISFLEDTGYMARAAFVMDRLMRSFGLHGKSFIPLLLGFGCSVPAMMGARILDNPKDRMVTVLVAPFMSCSARLPIYTLLIGAFFPAKYSGLALFLIYLMGIVIAIVIAKVFRRVFFAGDAEPFVMELPPYHMPTIKSVLMHMWERAYMYIKKAGTFIFAASVIVWFVVSNPADVQYSKDYDALQDKVTAEFTQKEADFMNVYSTDKAQQEKIKGLVDQMNDIASQQEDEDDADDASDDSSKAPDPVTIEAKGMTAAAVKAEADKNLETVPDFFGDLQKSTPKDEFAEAYSLYVMDQDKQGQLDELSDQQNAEKISQSYASRFGHWIEPILKPLGFNWKMGVSLVAALAAKEVLVSTLATIYAVDADADNEAPLQTYLQKDPEFTPLIAIAYMVFVLIYPPCIAAMSVMKRETSSWKWLGFMFFFSNALAWVCAFLVYQGGLLLGLH